MADDKYSVKDDVKEAGGGLLCFLVSVILPVLGLSYNAERGFHINILKVIFYTAILIALCVVTGNIALSYLGTCVASVALRIWVSSF